MANESRLQRAGMRAMRFICIVVALIMFILVLLHHWSSVVQFYLSIQHTDLMKYGIVMVFIKICKFCILNFRNKRAVIIDIEDSSSNERNDSSDPLNQEQVTLPIIQHPEDEPQEPPTRLEGMPQEPPTRLEGMPQEPQSRHEEWLERLEAQLELLLQEQLARSKDVLEERLAQTDRLLHEQLDWYERSFNEQTEREDRLLQDSKNRREALFQMSLTRYKDACEEQLAEHRKNLMNVAQRMKSLISQQTTNEEKQGEAAALLESKKELEDLKAQIDLLDQKSAVPEEIMQQQQQVTVPKIGEQQQKLEGLPQEPPARPEDLPPARVFRGRGDGRAAAAGFRGRGDGRAAAAGFRGRGDGRAAAAGFHGRGAGRAAARFSSEALPPAWEEGLGARLLVQYDGPEVIKETRLGTEVMKEQQQQPASPAEEMKEQQQQASPAEEMKEQQQQTSPAEEMKEQQQQASPAEEMKEQQQQPASPAEEMKEQQQQQPASPAKGRKKQQQASPAGGDRQRRGRSVGRKR